MTSALPNSSSSLPSSLLTPSTTTTASTSNTNTSKPSPATPQPPLPTPTPSQRKPATIYPREYSFPPFFTRQPNATTYSAQSNKWSTWILAYCRHHRIFKLSLADAIDSDLFWNRKIAKRLGLQDARELLEDMRAGGRVEWVLGDGTAGSGRAGREDAAEGRNVCWVWWRNPEEWALLIAEWVEETGQKNTVLTLYELTESEATIGQDFHGMDSEVLQKALNVLVKRGKAQVFGQADSQGVKFF